MFYFHLIVNSHAVRRNNTDRSHVLYLVSPKWNILQTTVQQHNQVIDIDSQGIEHLRPPKNPRCHPVITLLTSFLPQASALTQLQICSPAFQFYHFKNDIEMASHRFKPFEIGFFSLLIVVWCHHSSCLCQVVLFTVECVPGCGCARSTICLLKDIWDGSCFLLLWTKLLVYRFLNKCFNFSGINAVSVSYIFSP